VSDAITIIKSICTGQGGNCSNQRIPYDDIGNEKVMFLVESPTGTALLTVAFDALINSGLNVRYLYCNEGNVIELIGDSYSRKYDKYCTCCTFLVIRN